MQAKSYGIGQQATTATPLESALEELRILGYTVLPQVLDAEALHTARQKLDLLLARQEEALGREALAAINELNLVRCPLAYDEFFLHMATQPRVLEAAAAALGHYYILHLQNGIINQAHEAHHQSSWHRDLPYQEFVISKPLALGALFCIDDFTPETGGTQVLPFSHREERMPSAGYVAKHTTDVVARAGDVLLFDAMLYHRAGYNRSGRTRRAVNHVYTAPLLKQQIDLPALLGDRYAADAPLARLLGYESAVATSDVQWRQKRLQRLSSRP